MYTARVGACECVYVCLCLKWRIIERCQREGKQTTIGLNGMDGKPAGVYIYVYTLCYTIHEPSIIIQFLRYASDGFRQTTTN